MVANELTDQDRLSLAKMALLLEEIADKDTRVVVPPLDITEMVQAVQGLKGPASPDEIAEALARYLVPPQSSGEEVMRMVEAIDDLKEHLSARLQGIGRSFGSSGPANISSDASRKVGEVQKIVEPVEIANDSGNPIPVNGTVNVGNFPASVEVANDVGNPLPVSGTFWPATQPVSGSVNVVQGSYYRTDTFTAVANGATVDVTANPPTAYSIQVKGTGAAPTAWDVRLEGSLDGTNFTQILQHTTTTGDGVVLFSGTARSPARYIRARAAGLTLGLATDIVVSILGVRSA